MLRLQAGELSFAALAWGPPDGPLALCLHGYPDTARTWRHLGPRLARRGWRVVAPFLRGYAPTDLAPDGAYQIGALVRDVAELHRALGADERAVLIGHDWGAATASALAAQRPELFAKVVTLSIPPSPVFDSLRRRPDLGLVARQLRHSWYMFFQLLPGISERSLSWLIPALWRTWSPGYDAREDIADVRVALAEPRRATAALRYYRALFLPWMRRREYAREQAHVLRHPKIPLLYLHGEDDGCMLADLARRSEGLLGPSGRVELVAGAGHFLHLERPEEVGELIEAFVSG